MNPSPFLYLHFLPLRPCLFTGKIIKEGVISLQNIKNKDLTPFLSFLPDIMISSCYTSYVKIKVKTDKEKSRLYVNTLSRANPFVFRLLVFNIEEVMYFCPYAFSFLKDGR